MKDQITALMEALRLVGVEVEQFKKSRQGRDETLNAIERILDDPKVAGAVATIESLVGSPSLIPDRIEERVPA